MSALFLSFRSIIIVLLFHCSIPYGLPNSWGDSRPNCCNANGYSRTGTFALICAFYGSSLQNLALFKWQLKLVFSVLLQAGTQFWDEKMNNELAEGLLSGTAFDRWVGTQ